MGMGLRGGLRPEQWSWRKGDKGTPAFWLGCVDAGMQFQVDEGLQYCAVQNVGEEQVVLTALSDTVSLEAGESLTLEFRLLFTPFHRIDKDHWNWRMESQWGGNSAGWNMSLLFHGAIDCGNAFINYPFLNSRRMKDFIDAKRAQSKQIQPKVWGNEKNHPLGYTPVLYYTVRELSNHAAEMWVLRSLGDEIFAQKALVTQPDGTVVRDEGGGYPWLMEHLRESYAPAWRMPLFPKASYNDAAVATKYSSRWHNYYVEGWDWLIGNCGVQGLYLDGVGFDKYILRRMYNVMHQKLGKSYVEIHSGDDYFFQDRRESPMNKLMGHLPYVSKLWFGEMYSYDREPAYWLVEISGIPFGLTGEMLNYQNGGNLYRGMVYGMNSRMHAGTYPLWGFWDAFDIQNAQWIGYWDDNCPVTADRSDIKLSVYRQEGRTAIAFAHWPMNAGRKLAVKKVFAAPALNGVPDESWDEASPESGFTIVGGKDEVPEEYGTKFRMMQDGQYLYIALECRTPLLTPPPVMSRDSQVWSSDSVDIYLSCGNNNIQFIGDSMGNIWDTKNGNKTWNGDWQYTAAIFDDGWTGTLRLPLEELGTNPDKLRGNVCRTSRNGELLSSWSPCNTYGDNAKFGTFRLVGTFSPEELNPVNAGDWKVTFEIDWEALGLDPSKVTVEQPEIKHFQDAARYKVGEAIPFQEAQGGIIVLRERE